LLSLRPLFGHRIKRGVHRLDEVALQNGDLVVGSVEYDNYLNCAVVRGVIEQHAGSRVSEYTRVGLHDRADLVDCRIKLDPFWNPEAHLAGVWRRRLNAEVTQGLPPYAAIWHDDLHFVVVH